MRRDLLKSIPKVDVLMARPQLLDAARLHGHAAVLHAARQTLAALRDQALAGTLDAIPPLHDIAEDVLARAQAYATPSLRRVINATGVILHTNLGRARLADCAAQAAADVAAHYSTLEYDVATGERGSRHSHVSALLTELTGAQDAIVVNNNAAAVLLLLTALAKGREVIVSRGELVEIGGSFRVPDIMALSGATLREVGTTNRTHPADYANAIGEETAALLKVHTSNYKIIGFTREASLDELVAIGRARGVSVLYDLGGGCLLPPSDVPLGGEPGVIECVRAGVDVVCFSGDKLLGGPQAGILLGTREAIGRLRGHPLARALRVDKMTLAALEATLRLYRDDFLARAQIPTLAMLHASPPALREKAQALAGALSFLGDKVSVADEEGAIGGGTTPGVTLASAVVCIRPRGLSPDALAASLRAWSPPIVCRIALGRVLLDVRTLDPDDFAAIAACLQSALGTEDNV